MSASTSKPTPPSPSPVKPKPPAVAVDPAGKPESPAATGPAPADALSPEEQMRRFEKELKEQDWGHQPC